ncbi:histidinol-phosphate transaminase [Thalassotalea sp. M1531]|uniref:Histidinol-phosphate aminotransferase n=1 Tax=Thalassotalea algicola TaxID=2716224 RepID=A0A7Y0LBU8_9GAMM|nr:histidinol-phosphate transaminase [Thalassotalea algicola]NMP31328.1 histidinol-phosphate transaminase [Thalassotalea algicola]
MTGSIKKLARKELIDMVPYQSARRLQKADGESSFSNKIWLNANEASGTGDYQLSADCINRYPDFQPNNLLNAYSEYCQLPVENLLATRGADEGIELIIRTFCTAYQDSILICPPTYGMYAISAENHGAGVVSVPQTSCQLDVEAIVNKLDQVNIVFLCSPGNPTGNLLPKSQIKAVLDAAKEKAIVVVDEAYIEFSAQDSIQTWLGDYPNLVVLRTLSKAFALAGLRCGFTLASPEIITLLSKVIAPYPISAPVAELASQFLTGTNLQLMKERVQQSNSLRKDLSQWLVSQDWCSEVFASDANFVLFRTQYRSVIFDGLKAQGILIRDQSKQKQLDNCLRISIGSEQELNTVKQAINQIIDQTVAVQTAQEV